MGDITKKRIKEIAGSSVYERGVGYFESGMVRSITKIGNIVRAEVQGSRPEPYKVKLILDEDYVRWSCSCPYEGVCKHIVAVLLALKSRKEKKAQTGWKEKLSLLTKEELIEMLIPLVESDRDVKITLLNMLTRKGRHTAVDRYYEYWDEASHLLEDFQTYGGGPDPDEETIYYDLEEISKLFEDGKLSRKIKREFLDGLLDYYLGGNTGLDDLLINTAFRTADDEKDWIHIIERLKEKDGSWERELIMEIYRDHLEDKENYLKERMKELKYGLDYYDLVKFYQEQGDEEKAVKTAEEGVIKGEGRKIDLYEFLFNHYRRMRDYDKTIRYLKEIFKEKSSLDEYKRLITFSRNKKENSKWALSLLRKHGKKEILAAIHLYEKRYEDVLKYIMDDEGYPGFFDRREAFAEKIKKRYPREIIRFYEKRAQRCIEEKTRKGYIRAAHYIKRIKDIYFLILKDEISYKNYISGLREQYMKRPAFLEEIEHL